MFYAGYFVVENGDGARLLVRQFHGRRFFKSITRYELDSGARVTRLSGNTFQVAATGEKLLQVR